MVDGSMLSICKCTYLETLYTNNILLYRHVIYSYIYKTIQNTVCKPQYHTYHDMSYTYIYIYIYISINATAVNKTISSSVFRFGSGAQCLGGHCKSEVQEMSCLTKHRFVLRVGYIHQKVVPFNIIILFDFTNEYNQQVYDNQHGYIIDDQIRFMILAMDIINHISFGNNW